MSCNCSNSVAFIQFREKNFYMAIFLKYTNSKSKKKKKNVKANKQLYLFPRHCELKPYAALKGVPPPNGPRGDEGVN